MLDASFLESPAAMEEPQPQPQFRVTDCRDTRIIGKVRDSLLSRASAINPSVIERRIQELFNSFDTPTHPPYALMIQKAVMELNEGNGSTEEAISEFIKKQFEDLPWAHTRILGLHLRKLCQAEELLCTESGRYMLMIDCGNFGERKETGWRGSKKRKRSKKGRNHGGGERNKALERIEGTERSNGLQEQENEEQNQLSELQRAGTNEIIEERGKSEIGLLGMTEECHGGVAPAQSEAEKPQNKSIDERIQEAIMELDDKIGSSEIMNTAPHMAKEQHSMVIKKHIQCGKQPCDLLAVAENQTLTRQIEVPTEISRFCSDEIINDENLNASPGSPTIAVIPKEKLQILEQEEEQQQNERPSVQQKVSDACESLVDQEGTIFHLETTCSSQPTAPDLPVYLTSNSWNHRTVPISTESREYTPSAGIELTPTELQLQISKCGTSETNLCAASKMPTSLSSMTVHEHKLPQDWAQGSPKGRGDESTTFGGPEKHPPKPRYSERQPNWKPVANYSVESLLPSDGSILNKQKPRYDKIKKQLRLQPQGRGRRHGRGRSSKLDRNPHQHKEQLQLQDQALGSVSYPSLEPKETIYLSQPAPNLPVVVTPNHQQQLGDPISEGTPGCILSAKTEISPIQLQLQMSWHRLIDGDLGTTSKMEASLSSMNVYEDKPQQHGNKGVPKRKLNLDGKTAFGHLEQRPPKCRRRGRPPKPKPAEDWSGVSLLPSDDGIHNEKNPNFYNIVKRGQLQSQGRGRVRGRGRPPTLNCNEHHCELWPQDQAQGQVHSPNLPDDNNQSWEQTQGRCPKLESDAHGSCQKQMTLPQSSGQGRGRRALQHLRLPNGQSHQQLQLGTCQRQGGRLLRSSLTKPNREAS